MLNYEKPCLEILVFSQDVFTLGVTSVGGGGNESFGTNTASEVAY